MDVRLDQGELKLPSISGRLEGAPATGSAGLDYFLSKRTDLYLLTVYDRLSGYGTAMTYAAGIRHLF